MYIVVLCLLALVVSYRLMCNKMADVWANVLNTSPHARDETTLYEGHPYRLFKKALKLHGIVQEYLGILRNTHSSFVRPFVRLYTSAQKGLSFSINSTY